MTYELFFNLKVLTIKAQCWKYVFSDNLQDNTLLNFVWYRINIKLCTVLFGSIVMINYCIMIHTP